MELYIACSAVPLPAAVQIKQRAMEHGISVDIAPIDWKRRSGFMPVVINGSESGVEVDVHPAPTMGEILGVFANPAADVVISLRWGGDLAECACAFALAGAIASIVNGAILDPDSGEKVSIENAFAASKEALEAVS